MFGNIINRFRSERSSLKTGKAGEHVGATARKRKPAPAQRQYRLESLEDRMAPAVMAELFADLAPGLSSSYPRSTATVGSLMYFSAGQSGQLYVTDANAASVRRIDPPGRTFKDVAAVTPFGDKVLFSATDVLPNGTTEYGRELWISDGTSVGTSLLKDINPGPSKNSDVFGIVTVGDKAYFAARNPENAGDYVLWMTDGTTAGTKLVKRINPGGNDAVVIQTYNGAYPVANGYLFFSAFDDVNKTQLWRTDGTEAGTIRITSYQVPLIYPSPRGLNNRVFWNYGSELWYSDGTVAGTGSYNGLVSGIHGLTRIGDKIGFVAQSIFSTKYWVYTTDGNSFGTSTVQLDSNTAWNSANLAWIGNTLIIARSGDSGAGPEMKVYSSNLATTTPTLLLSYAANNTKTTISALKAVGSKAVLAAVGTDNFFSMPTEYWITDGSAVGTHQVIDPATGNSLPTYSTPYDRIGSLPNGDIFLSASRTSVGDELFKVGTPSGPAAEPVRTDILGRYGEAGQWYLGTSNGTSFTTAYWGAWSTQVNWVDVQTGDFNGDGKLDVVGRVASTGQWYVGLNNGNGFTNSLWGTWAPGATWVDVKVGDFNRDGRSDIVGRWKEGGHWYVGLSTGSSFATSFWSQWAPGVTWADVAVGDFNGDGRTDIAGRWNEAGQWFVGLSNGTSFATSYFGTWSAGVAWKDVRFADLNGDGRTDVVGRLGSTGEWYAGISNGSAFQTSYFGIWSVINWVDVVVGDFNGDGKADIAGRWKETGQWYVGTSTGTAFATSYWGAWSSGATWVDVKVGDFNGDGKADLVGRHKESGQWYVGRSTGAAFANGLWATWAANVTWADAHAANFA